MSRKVDQEKELALWKEDLKATEDPHTPPSELEQLAQKWPECSVILGKVAQHPNTSRDVLERLGAWVRTTGSKKWGLYTDTSVQSAVARNPNTSVEMRSRLLEHEDWTVRLNACWGKIYAILNKSASLDRLKDLDTAQEDRALWGLEESGIVVGKGDVYKMVPKSQRA